MHLSGHYSNYSPAFMGVLDAFPAGFPDQTGQDRPVPEASGTHRLGNGVVQRAVIEVLSRADRPMDVGEVHTTVEGLLGYPVSRDSVNSCLSTGARGPRPNSSSGSGRVATGSIALPDESPSAGVIATVLPRKQASADRPATRSQLVQSSSGAEYAARCSAHLAQAGPSASSARAFCGDRRGSRPARHRREARFAAVPCVRRGGLGYGTVVLTRVGRGDSRRMVRPKQHSTRLLWR